MVVYQDFDECLFAADLPWLIATRCQIMQCNQIQFASLESLAISGIELSKIERGRTSRGDTAVLKVVENDFERLGPQIYCKHGIRHQRILCQRSCILIE